MTPLNPPITSVLGRSATDKARSLNGEGFDFFDFPVQRPWHDPWRVGALEELKDMIEERYDGRPVRRGAHNERIRLAVVGRDAR